MDSVPTVFICGQVATHLAGTMAFQETDVMFEKNMEMRAVNNRQRANTSYL